jgi:predicted nucleic acid-binding Zn ribbon protein
MRLKKELNCKHIIQHYTDDGTAVHVRSGLRLKKELSSKHIINTTQ